MIADGLSDADARARVYVIDVNGLLTSDRRDLSEAQRRLAQPPGGGTPSRLTRRRGCATSLRPLRPTALLGLSSAAGAFTEEIVRTMAAHVRRPIIMPLSNPTSRSEARPQDLADWTEGRVLIATGSPFPPMQIGGATRPGRAVQQRVRVSGHRSRRDRRSRAAHHRRDADRGGHRGRRCRPDPRRPDRAAAGRRDRSSSRPRPSSPAQWLARPSQTAWPPNSARTRSTTRSRRPAGSRAIRSHS